ncbi:MAG: hypothetical protein GYB65_04270, partial [Chloroflexi bacterium]|nr:hypothetical protein [Chloroflexota bacterium]
MTERIFKYRYPRRRPVRHVLKQLIRLTFVAISSKVEVVGRENLPQKGPLLVVANHFSYVDPVAMIGVLPYPIEFLGGFRFVDPPKTLTWMVNLYGYYQVR